MLGVTWRGKVTNNAIEEKTKLPDTLQSSKWKWAGHAARPADNWANNLVKWKPSGNE